MATFYVGTSGWHYRHWQGIFYPPELSPRQWLAYFCRFFPTAEINATFYRLPKPETFAGWAAGTPPGFRFSVKASRLITHYRRLVDVAEAVATFYRHLEPLKPKTAAVLYQLPPSFQRDLGLLESFLKQIPPEPKPVFEFRHRSWFVTETYAVLEAAGAAFCITDLAGLNCPAVVTGHLIYLRLHGQPRPYSGTYTDEQLETWAAELARLGGSADLGLVYFNNDVAGHAVADARRLMRQLAGLGLNVMGAESPAGAV